MKQLMPTNANIYKQSARSNLPILNAVRKQLGLDCEDSRTKYKNVHLPSYDLQLNQAVMYQVPTTKG